MADGKDTASTTILVVDDSQTDRTLVTGLLSAERPDWTVLSKSAAADGLKVLTSQSVTAVITDLFMPEISGEEFLTAVRRQFPSVPVIVITSKGDDEIAARSLELGAVNYVPKRRLAEDLIPAIDEIQRGIEEAEVSSEVLSHLVRSRTIFHIDSDLEQIRSLLHLVRQRLETIRSLQNDQVRQVTDAVREALMNAYTHGSAPSSPEDNLTNVDDESHTGQAESVIEAELSLCKEYVCFIVTDRGPGFDTSRLYDGSESKTNNGFRTMRDNMDCIEFNDSGNRVVLTKKLTPPKVV